MRRWVLFATFLLATGLTGPVQAGPSGSVLLPVVTPSPVVAAFNAGVSTNLIGVVFPVPASADGKTYTLNRTSGFGNLDAYFYGAGPAGTVGTFCGMVPHQPLALDEPTEQGQMCPQSGITVAWGVVILAWGVPNVGFSISW